MDKIDPSDSEGDFSDIEQPDEVEDGELTDKESNDKRSNEDLTEESESETEEERLVRLKYEKKLKKRQ